MLTSVLSLIALPLLLSNSEEDKVHSGVDFVPMNQTSFRNKRNCPCRPLCSRGLGLTHPVCWSVMSLRYRYKSSNENIGDIHSCLYSLFQQIHGQQSSVETLVGQINRKLYDPKASFVVHLAGDNGVGKTMSAGLLSIAISLYPHQSHVNAGETLLIFPGSEYANITAESSAGLKQAAQNIRSRLIAHVTRFPRCVVLFDEITQFHPVLMHELNTIFAAIEHGKALDEVPMTGVFCFITSDFGSNGRTLGMSPVDIRTMVWEILQETYQNIPVFKKANIIPFVSLSPADFQNAIRYRLNILKCHHERKKSIFGNAIIQIVEFLYDSERIVEFLYSEILSGIPQRNGREIDRVFDDFIEGPLILKLAEFEIRASERRSTAVSTKRVSSMIESLFGNVEFEVIVSFKLESESSKAKPQQRLVVDVEMRPGNAEL